MINQIGQILLMYLCLSGEIYTSTLSGGSELRLNRSGQKQHDGNEQPGKGSSDNKLDKLNNEFVATISSGDTARSGIYVNSIIKILEEDGISEITASNSHYYLGVFYLLSGKNQEALNWLRLSSLIREKIDLYDNNHAKCLFNMGIAYNNLGDFNRMEQSILRSLEIEKKLYGESSPMLLSGFSALVTAYINLNEYSTAISYGNKALKLIEGSEENYISDIALIYANIGACHAHLSDYSKAILYLEKAESFYRENFLTEDEKYINLLNSLAATSFYLGNHEKSEEYFKIGLDKIKSENSALTLNFMNSFAITLGNSGNIERGEAVLISLLERASNSYGQGSREYYEVVKNYADYLRIYKVDPERSLRLYEKCIAYLDNHEEDLSLSDPVHLGYALVLAELGKSVKALTVIQKLLFRGISESQTPSAPGNPPNDLIKPVQWSINLLKAKYRVLWDIYKNFGDQDFLFAAAETSELIISLVDKVRLTISEEDSRLVLGDRFRDSYLYAIRDLDLCYKITGDITFLNKAFIYSEKSKVAGLLAATRELKATQFHIPADIAEFERRLRSEIRFYDERVSEEISGNSPDASIISKWKDLVMEATRKRDSLISMFETQYPEYHRIKYNTEVVLPDDIPGIAGRNTNYLNYVVSDTILYIFLVNRKLIKLFSIPVDSGFFSNVREFRDLLSYPSNDAKSSFRRFNATGTALYRILLDPVRKYFISDRLLISPDGILSYIPFEAIPMEEITSDAVLFNEVRYLLKNFKISYTYSATFLSESFRKDNSLSNSLIAFAPVYTGTINVDSLLNNREAAGVHLHDLPYARMEAEFVANMTGGRLFINNSARESVFKSEAGKYDIIHMAMHTVLNDEFPMHSKMLFYQGKDSVEDGSLNTYEVYGVPLKAKMVILSSCNTGTGILRSGEGIISLARGFVYSGSQSVIMSMWEIEDRSGTEIVRSFYRYLRRGASKSNALRRARIRYLANADMLRSHPYFWSSLVIYGNNSPLYFAGRFVLITVPIVLLISLIVALNHRKPR